MQLPHEQQVQHFWGTGEQRVKMRFGEDLGPSAASSQSSGSRKEGECHKLWAAPKLGKAGSPLVPHYCCYYYCYGPPFCPHARLRMKFSTAKAKGCRARRVSQGKAGALCGDVAGRTAESGRPLRKRSCQSGWAGGVLTREKPKAWILTLHWTSHCPWRKTSGIVFPCWQAT